MGLAEARETAAALLKRVEAGVAVPAAEKIIHPHSPDALTLGKLIDKYEAMRRMKGGRVKRLDAALRTVRNGLADYLKLPAKQFSKADLRAARDGIASRAPLQANRFLAYLGPVMKWAAAEDHIPVNFVPDVLKTASETKRERTLMHAEMKAIWHACDRLDGGPSARAFGRMVRFALLTLQRRDECASLKHGDLLDGTWTQRENKASRPHRLLLPQLAIDLVGTGEARDIAFAGTAGKISGFSKLKRELDKLSGVTDWRLHDLRRSGASEMQTLGVDEMVIRAVLNHSIPGIAQNYLRATLDKAKGEALAVWAAELERIVGARRAVS